MNTQTIAQWIVAVAITILTASTPYLSNLLKNNTAAKTDANYVAYLAQYAKEAVVMMEKIASDGYVPGSAQLQGAVTYVKEALVKLGFTATTTKELTNAVEAAYAQLKADGALDAYPAVTKEEAESKQASQLDSQSASLSASVAESQLASASQTASEAVAAYNSLSEKGGVN